MSIPPQLRFDNNKVKVPEGSNPTEVMILFGFPFCKKEWPNISDTHSWNYVICFVYIFHEEQIQKKCAAVQLLNFSFFLTSGVFSTLGLITLGRIIAIYFIAIVFHSSVYCSR